MTAPRRIRVVGNSGAGKTSFAHEVAARLGLPHLELDSVQHRPGWTEAPAEEFQAEVGRFRDRSDASADGWVMDGNYQAKLGGVLDDADCVVWLDYPRWLVMSRVVRRTLRRLLVRQELWNGNRERWSAVVKPDPEENIVLWAWTRHATYRERYAAESAQAPSRYVRLARPADAEHWLRTVERESSRRG